MNRFVSAMIAFSFFAAPAAFGDVFSETAQWHGNDAFNVLEVSGVRMNAVERALGACRNAGNALCELRATDTVKTNNREYSSKHGRYRNYTKIKAVVASVDQILGQVERTDVYRSEDSWDFSRESTPLKALGVRYDSLMAAVTECHEAGNDFCVLLNVTITESDNRYYDNDRRGYRYRTSAEATVRGYRLK